MCPTSLAGHQGRTCKVCPRYEKEKVRTAIFPLPRERVDCGRRGPGEGVYSGSSIFTASNNGSLSSRTAAFTPNPARFEKTQSADRRFVQVCGFYPSNSRKAADSLKCESLRGSGQAPDIRAPRRLAGRRTSIHGKRQSSFCAAARGAIFEC